MRFALMDDSRCDIKSEPATGANRSQALTPAKGESMDEAKRTIHDALARATALTDCPGTIMTLARYAAVTAVKQSIRDQGGKLAHFEQRMIVSAVNDYLVDHPELIEDAAETVRKVPQLGKLAEGEERQRRANLSSAAQKPWA
jgi:hypothetical protein